MPTRILAVTIAAAVAMMLVGEPIAAKVKVRTQFDKAFDFAKVRPWSWNSSGAGDVIMARTPDDDPATMKQKAEPVILQGVEEGMRLKKYEQTPEAGDLRVTYYLLLTLGTSTQTLGQFLPSVPDWGVPPFSPSTTSLEVIQRGSLVLDASVNGELVWRGIGEGSIKMDVDYGRRLELLREAVREVVRRLPGRS